MGETRTSAHYYDGQSGRRQTVDVTIRPDGLAIYSEDGAQIALWPLSALRRLEATGAYPLRLAILQDQVGAAEPRLDIPDEAFAATVRQRADLSHVVGETRPRERRKIFYWSIAAVVSLVFVVTVLLPILADDIATFIPTRVEISMGEKIDPQVRTMFGSKDPLKECSNPAGLIAYKALVLRLQVEAQLPMDLKPVVLNSPIPNAFAIPGGRVYVFNGLIQSARNADELAGVLAHELGHVYHRHTLRNMVYAGGLGFIFGTVLGDFTGGTVIMMSINTLMRTAASRDAEREADHYGVALMKRVGGDPRALAAILETISKGDTDRESWLRTHPLTPERARTIREESGETRATTKLLTDEQWTALRAICKE